MVRSLLSGHKRARRLHSCLYAFGNTWVSQVERAKNATFATGQYIGPFMREQVEANLGPFQTSPLSLVPKTSKPGKFQAVHNFSHLHNPLPEATSINLQIDGDNFPHWNQELIFEQKILENNLT